MDQESYIISFRAGSSGRLVGTIIWGSISENSYEYRLTTFNSTHIQTPWATSVNLEETKKQSINSIWRSNNIYSTMELVENPALITVHSEPNFKIIFSRFPKAKIVIISLTEKDILEVATNSLLKNGLENIQNNANTNNLEISFLKDQYKKHFGKEFNGEHIPIELRRQFFLDYSNRITREIRASYFINPIVPKEHLGNTLILSYHDIMHDMQYTLNEISKFINRDIKPELIDLYQKYLEGREKVIREYTPWVNL